MIRHPDIEQLVAFAAGERETDAESPLTAHLAGCADCAGTVARYRLVAETLRLDDAAAPPPRVVARAKALFAAQPLPVHAEPRELLEPLRRVIAELIFDSGGGLTPALAGFRGGGDRHLTYVAESVQVDLQVQPPDDVDGGWRVLGQVDAGGSLPAATVDVVPSGEERSVGRARTDESGMFTLVVPEGRYDILVRLSDFVQVLPGLVLG